jgi:hypothetical protein
MMMKDSALDGTRLLDSYEAERLPVARHVLEETDRNQKLGVTH